ncbi:MAG: putative porin [Bacteroidia bacterium]
MNSRSYIYILICSLLAIEARADMPGPADTTVRHNVTDIYTEGMLVPYNIWQKNSFTVDTTLDRLENYTNRYSLGNPGLPIVPVIFNSAPTPLGFYYGDNHLGDYIRNDTSARYYNTRAPYLTFYYVTDPQIHQFLDLTLTQNFGKKFNLAVEFRRVRSEGIYLNQGSNLNQLTVTANYHSKHYMLLFDGIYNMLKINQNGGIQNDTDFTSSNFTTDRQTVPVYLATANTTQATASFRVHQFYFFGCNSADTGKTLPRFYVSHTISFSTNYNVYSDLTPTQDSAFYPIFKYDSVTYDSLRYIELNNDFSIGSAKGWNSFMRWDAGIADQWVHFTDFILTKEGSGLSETNTNNMYRDTVFSNLMAHARIYNTYANGRILFDAGGSYIFSGTQQGDEQGSADIGLKIDSLRMVKLSGNYSYQTPALIYDLYDGNNFQWLNHFSKVTTSTASLLYMDAGYHLSIGGEATQIQNMVYFSTADVNSVPGQSQGAINILKAHIEKNFTLGKWHWNTKEIYQYVPGNVPIHLPLWVTENSLFYENYLFHHHMLLRIGLDIFYNTSYYVYAYQPVFDQFYLQNNTKLGNYFYFDPFISFRIKTFRMFLKMENVTSGLLQTNAFYGYALNYPMPDEVLRFGISWDFWN